MRASQARRQVVAAALRTGRHRAWDLVPDPEPRYVRATSGTRSTTARSRPTDHVGGPRGR
ncbi:hypothetical protein [Serinicoccus sp. CNJ-927]|uniref:hypothetical protein n=1 Tax=Serinicoccus sp. CNJ-927 TaxID=1904970 RepID=UPI001EDA4B42|nr:hypothetical protein [Serinicoccus sp. CNJ-927]